MFHEVGEEETRDVFSIDSGSYTYGEVQMGVIFLGGGGYFLGVIVLGGGWVGGIQVLGKQ